MNFIKRAVYCTEKSPNASYEERFVRLQCSVKKIHAENTPRCMNKSEHITMATIFHFAVGIAVGRDFEKSPVGIGISMKELAREINVSPAMVTKTITSLENKGYVSRISDTDDRRGVKVCFTEKGYEMWKAEHERMKSLMERVFARLGKEKTEQFFMLSEEFVEIFYDECKRYKNSNKM